MLNIVEFNCSSFHSKQKGFYEFIFWNKNKIY